MSNEQVVVKSSGIGLGGILTIIFVIAKLLGVITWSWWWVLSPLWIGAAFGLTIMLIVLVFAIIAAIIGAILN